MTCDDDDGDGDGGACLLSGGDDRQRRPVGAKINAPNPKDDHPRPKKTKMNKLPPIRQCRMMMMMMMLMRMMLNNSYIEVAR
jgi:hypothetical protein